MNVGAIQQLQAVAVSGKPGHLWVGDMYLGVFHVPVFDAAGKAVIDRETKRQFVAPHVRLTAHLKGSRAVVIPFRTSFLYGELNTLGRQDKPSVRELKRDILLALYGEQWHECATIENPDGTFDVGDDMPIAPPKVGVADTEAPARKRSRGRQRELRREERDKRDREEAAAA